MEQANEKQEIKRKRIASYKGIDISINAFITEWCVNFLEMKCVRLH